MMPGYILLLTSLVLTMTSAVTAVYENENNRVTCYIDFDIFVSHKEQFCNGTETIDGILKDGVYFQYRTSNNSVNRPWTTVDIYNATRNIKEIVLEFQSNDIQFRWIQYDTLGSPGWAIDDIVIDCTCPAENFFKTISFEEDPNVFNENLICHSGFRQQGAKDCSDTQYSMLLNETNRELRTASFNLLNGTSQESKVDIPNHCQPQVCLGPSLSHGLVWSTTQVNATARMQCSEISELFWSGLNATRKCLDGGVWDEVDMSQCTIKDTDEIPFIVYSTYLQIPEHINNSSTSTVNQLQQSFDVYNISVTMNLKLYTKENFTSVTLAVFTVTFNEDIENNIMIDVAKHLATVEVNYTFAFQDFPEVVIMNPVDVCQCKNSFTIEEEHKQRITVVNICVGISIPPCISDDSDIGSKCNEPHYTGNVTNCVIMDTSSKYDCDDGYDMEFGIRWEGSRKNLTVPRICPNGTGNTSRLCDSLGNWHVPDVQRCNNTTYHNLFERVCNITALTIDINEVNSFLMDFAETIRQTNFSIFPLDLKTVNNIMGKLLIAIEENTTLLNVNITESLLNIYDSIFDVKNEPGFQQLMEIDRTENQVLIVQSEKLGMLLATNTDIENGELAETNFTKENFVLSIQRSFARDITFRPQLSQYDQTSLQIPAQLLEQKPKDVNGMVPVVNIIYRTLHRLLPDTRNSNGHVKEPVSVIISSQVGNRNAPSLLPRDNPIILNFDHNAPDNMSNITRCAFWNFTQPHAGGDGGWDSTEVVVAQESRDGHITCHSSHLTCFIVLVDVSRGSDSQETAESTALSIVTYIGCGISMISLLAAIVFLIIYRNTILNGVHNFAHLNLSIAILLALIVFVAGIETAANNQIACTIVAALLHYLFTAVFSWMLCEGILLYFLIVKVFSSKFTKRKWPYFILGWGIPLPVVATAVGIAHHHYGNDKFCWISTDDGTIWAFVGPMLLIVLVNTIVLIMVLRVLFKTKSQSMTTDEAKQVDAVKSLMKAAVVLLPLLGVTWVFGLLAVNRDLTVFAWIFTVLNSLQGLLILLFHVLRNEKIRENIGTTVMVYTSSLKRQVTSKLYSSSHMQDKTRTSVKIIIEQCEGDTTKPVNGTKAIDNSSYYAQTIETYCSERKSSQMPSPKWQQSDYFVH